MSESGNPFHPMAPGRHVTDAGLRYTVHTGDMADVDFLMGREIDIGGCTFAYADTAVGPIFPSVFIELCLMMQEVVRHDGQIRIADSDVLAAALTRRGLQRVDRFDIPPDVDTIEWVVYRRARGRLPSGVYGPGPRRERRSWVAIHPMPHTPQLWHQLLAGSGHQCGIYLTTRTQGVHLKQGESFVQALTAAAADGDLWGTRAAVL